MCGISALFSRRPVLRHASFRRSLDLIRHRGPDGRGIIWGRGGEPVASGETHALPFSWALGHVRLAILDTSAGGLQPMSGSEGGSWISYNGEIYNYLELRRELEPAGYQFRTGTDTEVLLAAYDRWGEACVERFVGMFAFVLVDRRRGRVFCARDRFGVKPLHIWQGAPGTFLFSEIKQLRAFPEFTFRANRPLLIDFLADGVVNHVPDQTLVEGVTLLAPGHSLSWELDGPGPDPAAARPYWRLQERPAALSRGDAVERIRAGLIDAVRIRLRSDVPVGSCLSGGLDSSSLVGIAAKDCGSRLRTFSSCFNGFRQDEQPYMDAVNRHCGTLPFKVFPEGGGLLRELDWLVYHQDEPFGGPSIYAQWCVMRAAREANVPVLLDGQGGDEALCGYRKYTYFHLAHLLRRGRLGRAAGHAGMIALRGDPQLLRLSEGRRYLPRFLRGGGGEIGPLLRPDAHPPRRAAWRAGNAANRSVKDFQKGDLLHWSLPALLRYEDRNSMAHSVESRVPFVDHRFVELCLGLPEDLFFIGGRTKRLLTLAMGDRLPREVHERRTKYGFTTPCDGWMRGELGRSLESEVARSAALGAVADTRALARGFADFRRGQPGLGSEKLFSIGCVAVWMRIFKIEPGAGAAGANA